MPHKFLGLLPPLLLGLLAGPVSGRPAPASDLLVRQLTAAPPDSGRATRVRGTVRLAQSGRPLAGVLLVIETCSFGYLGAICNGFTGDSTRTDAQGHYELRFYSQKDQQYAVRFDPAMGRRGDQPNRYVFHHSDEWAGPRAERRYVTSDTVTTADFAPDFAPNYSRPIELHLPKVGH
jgi:hypothetical protein